MWKTQSLPKCSGRERAKLAQPSKYSQPGPVRRVESAQPELPCQGPVCSGNSFLQLLRGQPWGLNAFCGTRPFFGFVCFFLFLRFCSREKAQQHFKKVLYSLQSCGDVMCWSQSTIGVLQFPREGWGNHSGLSLSRNRVLTFISVVLLLNDVREDAVVSSMSSVH